MKQSISLRLDWLCLKNSHTNMLLENFRKPIAVVTQKIYSCLSTPISKLIIKILLIVLLLMIINHAFATDLLANTDADIKDTIKNSGKMYLYAIEGFIGLCTFMTTRKLTHLSGVLIVAVFINVLLKFTGWQ